MSEPELIAIASGELTAGINPLGAELWSLTDRQGRALMTNADPAFWTGHAPLLFPIVGALKANRYRHGGKTYELPRHGFARRSIFERIEHRPDAVRFRLTDSEETRAAYPFAFSLEAQFRIEGATLRMMISVANPGDEVLPFSFGYHPAFAWPLPGGADKEAHVVAFDQPEPGCVRRLDPATGLLLEERFDTPVEGHLLALDAVLFEPDALIWSELSSRQLTYGTPGGTQLLVAFPDTPMLGLWQKPGANFLCIEPWQGIADPVGFAGEIGEKPGVVLLPPGAVHAMRMDVTLLPAS